MSNLPKGKKSLMSDCAFGTNPSLDDTTLRVNCSGCEISRASITLNSPSDPGLSGQDDDCHLVLGLGPTPYVSDHNTSGGLNKFKESAILTSHQWDSKINPDMLELGLSRGNAEPMIISETRENPFPSKNQLLVPVVDEISTSAKKTLGGYIPALLFAPRLERSSLGDLPEIHDQLNLGGYPDGSWLQHAFRLTAEPMAANDLPAGAIPDSAVHAQRKIQRHFKRCMFQGCTKGARGASAFCIHHGGGERCHKPRCNKGAESRTAFCKFHGGGKRCQMLGCIKSAEGKTEYCIAHGGGRRCNNPGCTKAARGKSGLCIKHGGGKRCIIEDCKRSAEGQAGLCISHGGGRRCQFPDCVKGAQGSTKYCKAHGGGRRCIFEGCKKGAEGSTSLCKAHGGGKRCQFQDGGICSKSVHGGTMFCVAHGGGKRCIVQGCTKSARGRTDCCVKHGGGKRCQFDGCDKSAQGSTDFCKAHGGGKRCTWVSGCDKFARGRNGLCAAHGTMMASQQQSEYRNNGSMISSSLFQGIVSSSMTIRSNMDNENSSSASTTVSDSSISQANAGWQQLRIPPQVLVPNFMRSSSSSVLTGMGSNGVTSRGNSLEFLFPEGRVHGGSFFTQLGGSSNNVLDAGLS